MKFPAILLFITLSLPLSAVACPTGMQFNGNGCSPPYEYTGWDLMRDRRAAIDAIGSDTLYKNNYSSAVSPEEFRELEDLRKKVEKEKEERMNALAKGIWTFDSHPTPEGKLCAAVFAKFTPYEGGVVTMMGVKSPQSVAWVIFHGAGLPKSKDVKKINIAFQQGNEPVQTVPAINYRHSSAVGTVILTIPGLTALVDGMLDKQRLRLTDKGKTLLDIEWDSAAPIIEKLKQCAK